LPPPVSFASRAIAIARRMNCSSSAGMIKTLRI
jgi:hypothetical protein